MASKEATKQEINLGFPDTDVTLVVEGHEIHVNKAVLSEHSPVFKVMFESKFKESTAKEIVLHDKRAEDVVEFLKSFYPNMKYSITADSYRKKKENMDLPERNPRSGKDIPLAVLCNRV